MKTLLALSLAASAWATPVAMTGSGSWTFLQGGGGEITVFAAGTGAQLSYSGPNNASEPTDIYAGTVSCGPGCNGSGYASVGLIGSSYFEFDLDGPVSILTLFSDSSGQNEIATAELVGYVDITSEFDHYHDGYIDYSYGTFLVEPAPEPGAGWMMLAGAAALLVARLVKRERI